MDFSKLTKAQRRKVIERSAYLKVKDYLPLNRRLCENPSCDASIEEHVISSLMECFTCAKELYCKMKHLVDNPPAQMTVVEANCFGFLKGLIYPPKIANFNQYHLLALKILIKAKVIPDYYHDYRITSNLPFEGKLYISNGIC